MSGSQLPHPPEMARLSGLYRFIPPESFATAGIDPEDVPLGTFPAQDHPPFLPNRFGGNAYGLGLFEQALLPAREARFLESLDLERPEQVAGRYRELNDIMKRLGLLIRYTQRGEPFYLIPRQFVAHYLVEIQARVDEIAAFLAGLFTRRLKENLRIGLASPDSELVLPELKARLPQLDFVLMDSLKALVEARGPFDALVVLGHPQILALRQRQSGSDRQAREAYGFFLAARAHDLLSPEGELLCISDRPLGTSRETIRVAFKEQGEFKRFLMFSHVYRTRRRYQSGEGLTMDLNRFDFYAFLAGLGVYQETVEGLLGGRTLAGVEPREIDRLPYQDLPLPRGSTNQLLASLRRHFAPFFSVGRLCSQLPQVQRDHWRERFAIDGEFPDTQVVFQGVRRRPPVALGDLLARQERRHLTGCSRELLADYKDGFAYVQRVLVILNQIKDGTYRGLPGLELARLRQPFESAVRHDQLKDVLELMEHAPRLLTIETRLNPDHLLGTRTPVLANLEKLSLLGFSEGMLTQLVLIVLGHSPMSRVTFGKLPPGSLRPLADPGQYRNVDDAVRVLGLYRLLSVAETEAASRQGLTPEQGRELFGFYDDVIRTVAQPGLTWDDLLAERSLRLGGPQAQAVRKLLKLFDLFEFLDGWRRLEDAGSHQKEVLADFDPGQAARIRQVEELLGQVQRFLGAFYPDQAGARPFFLRAFLSCELHGSGRLLPRLGPATGFTLLWLCVHVSPRRILNFNPLLGGEEAGDPAGRLALLRGALAALKLEAVSPARLAALREEIAQRGEAYLDQSGLYFRQNQRTGALEPRVVEPAGELDRLAADLKALLPLPLAQVPTERLASVERAVREVGRFLAAQPSPAAAGALAERYQALVRRLEQYATAQLLDLNLFAEHLARLLAHLPHLLDRLLPQPAGHPLTQRRLAAARKLSALFHRRLDQFQDLLLSHELARAEFGPTAAGILGVSPLQFQGLTASLGQLLERGPSLARLLMAGVLLYRQDGQAPDVSPASPLLAHAAFAPEELEALGFLLEHHELFWQIINGEACLSGLAPLLERQDPFLVEALFLLAVVLVAAREEGLLSEDLLDRFLALLEKLRGLARRGASARDAHREDISDLARRYLAFEHYREIQEGQAPAASLRHLLEATRLPAESREQWLAKGRLQAGLDRLLRLRGLYFVTPLDVRLLRFEVPVRYVYRLKNLRSLSETHYERDLFEGLRIYRGLKTMDRTWQVFLLEGLADPERPVRLHGYAQAARLLTYPNQIRLLLMGVAAGRLLAPGGAVPREVDFLPLAGVIEHSFEEINQAVGALDPARLLDPAWLEGRLAAREGLCLRHDPKRGLSLIFRDALRHHRKLAALKSARTPDKLKRLYHQELRRIKLAGAGSREYQRRLGQAFEERLGQLGEGMLQATRDRLSAAPDQPGLLALYEQAWEEGLALPLSPDRQEALRDLLDLNLERLRAAYLAALDADLATVGDFATLADRWEKVKAELLALRPLGDKGFELTVAERFDRQTRALKTQGRGAGPARRA